jgi:hypothetical protein
MIIYVNNKSKQKKKKPDAKVRALRASWQALLKKYDITPTRKTIQKSTWMGPTVNSRVVVDPRRLTHNIPSLDTGKGLTTKKESPKYTGNEMIGIGQLHKSNAIPIFKQKDAEDLAKMRR